VKTVYALSHDTRGIIPYVVSHYTRGIIPYTHSHDTGGLYCMHFPMIRAGGGGGGLYCMHRACIIYCIL
jgi:hypothetical protein